MLDKKEDKNNIFSDGFSFRRLIFTRSSLGSASFGSVFSESKESESVNLDEIIFRNPPPILGAARGQGLFSRSPSEKSLSIEEIIAGVEEDSGKEISSVGTLKKASNM